jgi:hypothetical protein
MHDLGEEEHQRPKAWEEDRAEEEEEGDDDEAEEVGPGVAAPARRGWVGWDGTDKGGAAALQTGLRAAARDRARRMAGALGPGRRRTAGAAARAACPRARRARATEATAARPTRTTTT